MCLANKQLCIHVYAFVYDNLCLYIHVQYVPVPCCAAQSPRVTDEFIQHVKYLAEGGSLCSLSLPAIQH